MRDKIIRNRIKCNNCGDIIESKHVHDFVQCRCEGVFVDGGREYLRRGFNEGINFEDLSIVEHYDGDGNIINEENKIENS